MTTLSLIEAHPDPADFWPVGMAFPLAEAGIHIGEAQCLFVDSNGKAGTDRDALCENLDLWILDGGEPDPLDLAMCGLLADADEPTSAAAWVAPPESATPLYGPLVPGYDWPWLVSDWSSWGWCCSTAPPPHVVPPVDVPAPVPLPATGVLLILALGALVWRTKL